MTTTRMHENEFPIDTALVQRLLAAQFPAWAALPLHHVASAGTDNALFRLGDELVIRLPRIDWAVGQARKAQQWLPRITPHLPLRIPEPVALGEPGSGYPWPWSIHRWLPGENLTLSQLADPEQTARDLADFILALQQIDTAGGPAAAQENTRGLPLRARDRATRAALAQLQGIIDIKMALAVWEEALAAPDWVGAPVWLHGDMLPGNLLFVHGRLHAVIDWGGLAVGDPACDLMIAWNLFGGRSRAAFREALAVEEATWLRGIGHALSQAVIFIPYYRHTNPTGVQTALRACREILSAVNKPHCS